MVTPFLQVEALTGVGYAFVLSMKLSAAARTSRQTSHAGFKLESIESLAICPCQYQMFFGQLLSPGISIS